MPTPARPPDVDRQADAAHARLLAEEAELFAACDPFTQPVVAALAAGRELPDEFLILDTYADCGDPPSVWRLQRIRREVRRMAEFFGITMRLTNTLLDRTIGLEESLVQDGII